MGADGGICHLKVTDPEVIKGHVWFWWRVANPSCQAYKGDTPYCEAPDLPGDDWVEGGFGTDCDFDFSILVGLAEFCTDTEGPVEVKDGSTDVRDMTFGELEESLRTDPTFDLWDVERYRGAWWDSWHQQHFLGPITQSLVRKLRAEIPRERDGYLAQPWPEEYVPERFKDMTLREWGTQLDRLILGRVEFHETWT